MSAFAVCLFCGSRNGASPAYAGAAEDFGQGLARLGMDLVYGGGDVGLMGIAAGAAASPALSAHRAKQIAVFVIPMLVFALFTSI